MRVAVEKKDCSGQVVAKNSMGREVCTGCGSCSGITWREGCTGHLDATGNTYLPLGAYLPTITGPRQRHTPLPSN